MHVYVIKGTVEVAVNQLREARQRGAASTFRNDDGVGDERGDTNDVCAGGADGEGGSSRPLDVLTGLLGIDNKGTKNAPVELDQGMAGDQGQSAAGQSRDQSSSTYTARPCVIIAWHPPGLHTTNVVTPILILNLTLGGLGQA